jgi:large subunit ribosomal protein L21
MYAVIVSGGKQYRVSEGETLKLELLPAEVGSDINFDKVLMVCKEGAVQIGRPYLEGGSVSASILAHGRHDKVHIVKFKRRKHSLKWQGHRQHYTEVKIKTILA